MNHDLVAGVYTESGRLVSGRILKAIESCAVFGCNVKLGQIDGEDAILTAQVGRFFDHAADGGARA
jgi:hypothetical protein